MASGNHGLEARTGSRFAETIKPFNFVAALRERHKIRRICSDSLTQYQRIVREMPQASNLERYTRVIEECSGADTQSVQSIMRRIEENFATWPVERPLHFRDVVQYIALTGGLKAEIAGTGVRSRFVDLVLAIVADSIPANL